MTIANATSAASSRPCTAESDPTDPWQLFLESHSPAILRQIRRAGLGRPDEVMDVYLRVCERLRQDECARLAAFDPCRGTLAAWLAVVVRRATVDWVRSRAGRRRHFASIRRLGPLERRAFELKYWQDRPPDDYPASLSALVGRQVHTREAAAALERVERALGPRHRAELCAAATRGRPVMSIDRTEGEPSIPLPDPNPNPEERLLAAEMAGELGRILALLPDEDRQILQLKFAHGCSHRDISMMLGIEVSDDRVRRAVARIRALIAGRGLECARLVRPRVRFLTTIPFRRRPDTTPSQQGGMA